MTTRTESAEEYLEAALSAYSGNDLRTRELALADLAQAGEGMVASFAAVVARAEQSPERAAAAISALGAMGGPLARDALCRALETHATPWVRARCAFELGRARDPRLDRDRVKTVRLFISGSAPLLPDTFAEFEARTGHRILERYGMTETQMISSNPLHGDRHPGTVGLPLPGVEVMLKSAAYPPNGNARPLN